jgi:hypothetical protein
MSANSDSELRDSLLAPRVRRRNAHIRRIRAFESEQPC